MHTGVGPLAIGSARDVVGGGPWGSILDGAGPSMAQTMEIRYADRSRPIQWCTGPHIVIAHRAYGGGVMFLLVVLRHRMTTALRSLELML